MDKKIEQFLEQSGYFVHDGTPASIQLLRFFEEEYGVSLMALLEQEWFEEQLEDDDTHDLFSSLREHIDEGHLQAYDQTVHTISAL